MSGAVADEGAHRVRVTLAVVLVMLVSPIAVMLDSPPGELGRLHPRLNVEFNDGATATANVAEGTLFVGDYDVSWQGSNGSL